MRAWKPGVIAPLMDAGMPFGEIMQLARWNGALLFEGKQHNLIVNSGLYLTVDHLIAVVTSGLTYHAIGTGTNTPAVTDTQLQTEVARAAYAIRSRGSNVGTFDAFFPVGVSTFNLKEAGVFGGAATGTANSGTLFSHYLQSYNNSVNLADLTFEYQLTVTAP